LRLAPALCLRPFPPCHRQLALENVALRQQLTVYKRLAPRPKLRPADRRFWAGLARVWTGWRQALVIVSPDTVLRWQRRRFPRSNPWSGEWPRRIRSGAPHDPWRVAQARHPPGRTHRLAAAPQAALPAPLRPGGRFSPITSKDLVSIDFFTVPTVASPPSSSSSCSLTTAGASSTSTSPSTPPPPGPLSSSSMPSLTSPRRPTSSRPRSRLRCAVSASREGRGDRGGAHGAAESVGDAANSPSSFRVGRARVSGDPPLAWALTASVSEARSLRAA
jgi:hypothetical protein